MLTLVFRTNVFFHFKVTFTLMSLDTLKKDTSHHSDSPKRSYAWMLPLCLLIGFLLVILILFGKTFLPATEVQTAPVITLRQAQDAQSSNQPVTTGSTKGELLFQATGWIEPDPYTTYVPTLTNGIVDKVLVLEGESVKKGQLLATLIQEDAELDLKQAEKKVTAMQARIHAHCAAKDIIDEEIVAAQQKAAALAEELKSLNDRYDRLTRLTSGAIPEQDKIQAKFLVTRQQALIKEAKAEVPQLKAKLVQIDLERETMERNLEEAGIEKDRAQLAFDRTKIHSPMDGIVLRLHAAPGKKRYINMDDPHSAEIVELYDPNMLQARIDVPLTEAAALSVGQAVTLTSELLPDKEFSGVVTRITGEADIQRNTLQAKVSINNPDPRLRPGMLVRGKFFSSGQQSTVASDSRPSGRLALYVPEAALFEMSGNSAKVWVASESDTVEMRDLTLTQVTRENHRQVTEGLRSGEQVILPPFDNITPGDRIIPTPTKLSSK
ncbi:RND family efflux transporter, MFP subunit [Rubritalea squalenifaciens DSM 18772]|uniref:RND family efflux transporter, MFP subunit n=2 Tax=Rubritalea squalenifaciens TaxID=407226 RepID=A0A1M6IZ30_9BACT|nr:RND family efflux transporter, MFP subunit [Rubritalea squalenifaciens DSM 18772]